MQGKRLPVSARIVRAWVPVDIEGLLFHELAALFQSSVMQSGFGLIKCRTKQAKSCTLQFLL